MGSLESDLVAEARSAVSPGAGEPDSDPAPVEIRGEAGRLRSRFAVEEVAVASVASALSAATALSKQRGGRVGAVSLDRGHVADAVRSERFFSVGEQSAGAGFAPLSRFWAAADGWVRTHANYPWHRSALIETLGTSADADAVAAAMARLPAEEIEEKVFAAGGIATAVRNLEAWRRHPQGEAVAAEVLVGHRMTGEAPARTRGAADLPMTGVRVLDLTRVIAGPVCTRFLGALGAEVLRLDPPDHADMRAGVVADTLLGKRSALLDLASPVGVTVLEDLLGLADVVVCGYRPGALDRFGLGEDRLTEDHPGIVVVYLDAWGHSGPWAGRRGFDSVVQGPTGIAMGEASTGHEPGALPCQILDHGTGYLAAAAVMDGLRRQGARGGTHVRRLSLARTAWWLTSHATKRSDSTTGSEAGIDTGPPPPWLDELDSAKGRVTAVGPPGSFDGRPLRWPFALTGYGQDRPAWSVVP
jgi:hypothetical protein